MKRERAEYIETVTSLGGDIAGRRQALDDLEKSDVWVAGAPAPFPYVPYLFNEDDWDYISGIAKMTHRILCKVIERYLKDPAYREMFALPKEVERLVMLPCGYDQLLPICRFDMFLDESDKSFKFCEFNADGTGAMSRDSEVAQALMKTESFKRFSAHRDVQPFELFDTWVEAFMRIYQSDKHAVAHPTVALVDFRESGVMSDFRRFIAAFERAGIPARFVDIRELAFDGEELVDSNDGTRIDAIYRRAVTSEILQHPGECDALIDAVAAEKVCLIGHFRTSVVHSKMVSIALFDPQTRAFLTDEEAAFIDAHLPHTHVLDRTLDPTLLEALKRDKDAWIIKPADDYGAHGVFPGVDYSQEDWERLVDGHLDASYIMQEFYPPHTVDIIDSKIVEGKDPCEIESWKSMPGCYVYDGKPIGMYCRLGQGGVIAIDHDGLCSASFLVK
ncbi:MAG: hypothetical protein ACOX69_03880 [Coriobacteriales bacterium]|jgi:hypothetical protein